MKIVVMQGSFDVEREESHVIVQFPHRCTITDPEGKLVPHIPVPVPPCLRGSYCITSDRADISVANVSDCAIHIGMGERTVDIPLTDSGSERADIAEATAHAILALLCLAHGGQEMPSAHHGSACPIRFIHMPDGATTMWGQENGLPRFAGVTQLDPADRAAIYQRLLDMVRRGCVDPSRALEASVIAMESNAHLSRLTETTGIAWAAIGATLEIYLPIIPLHQASWCAAASYINAKAAALEPTWGETEEDLQYWDNPDAWWILQQADSEWYIE